MVAGSRIDSKQKKLATEMNVPPVAENLYVKTLQNRQNRHIPYETQLSQNSKTK